MKTVESKSTDKETPRALLIPRDLATENIHNAIDDYMSQQWLNHRRRLTKPEAAAEMLVAGAKGLKVWKGK